MRPRDFESITMPVKTINSNMPTWECRDSRWTATMTYPGRNRNCLAYNGNYERMYANQLRFYLFT